MYVYCLSDDVTARMLEEAAGVAGARPRIIGCYEISVVVSDFEGETVAINRENVFAHERVIQNVLRHTTPLPFRFGTLVSAERLEAYVAANRDRLVKSMERVRDSVEMSVKIIWDAEAVRRAALRAEQVVERKGDEALSTGKGTAYLAAKRREIMGDELLKERAEEIAAWLAGCVSLVTKEQVAQVRPVESLVVRAAYLVGREHLSDYQERLDEARRERAHLRFLTSGPWPPYSFSNINP